LYRGAVERRPGLGVFLILFGLLLAVIAGVMVFRLARQNEQLLASAPTRWFAVANVDIGARSIIAPNQVVVVQIGEPIFPASSANYLPDPGASDAQIQAGRQALIDRVAGQYTPEQIDKGEIIDLDRLGQKAAQNTPSYEVPIGQVAFPFPVKLNGGTPANGNLLVAFLDAVRPGDFVDIYYSSFEPPAGSAPDTPDPAPDPRYLVTRPIFQNLKVLNVGFFPGTNGQTPPSTNDERYLTFQVTPDQALALKWLKDAATLKGNIDFVLRNPGDTQVLPSAAINYQDMASQYGIGTGH